MQPRILVLLDAVGGPMREALVGILDYAHEHGPWQIALSQKLGNLPVVTDVAAWRGDGLLVRVLRIRWQEVLRRRGVKAVAFGRGHFGHNLPAVTPDDYAVGRLAAEHFRHCGLANFGYCGVRDYPASKDRWTGFRDTLAEHGQTSARFWFGPLPSPATEQRALRDWLAALPRPAGVLAFNDTRALLVLDACRQTGRHVPDDIAVLGVDNDELLCRLADPPLSSVDGNARRIGYEAAALLDRLRRGRPAPTRSVIVAPRGVVQRRSTDVLAVGDPRIRAALLFIRAQADKVLFVSAVARQAGLSRRALERRFRKTVGRSVNQEIIRTHLGRAQQLLAETDLSMEQVAEQSGFTDAKQMGAVFRHQLRTTATAYRAHRGDRSDPPK